jgi:hypothetical protein
VRPGGWVSSDRWLRMNSLANVVSIVADVVDALFDAHSLAGGWRDFVGPAGAPDDSVA